MSRAAERPVELPGTVGEWTADGPAPSRPLVSSPMPSQLAPLSTTSSE